jgi:arabinofuranan 3-O-arabinosyltransferase
VVDTKPELYLAPWRSAAAYLSAWQANPQLGFPSFNVGLAPVAATVGLIQAVGIPPELSVRVLRLLLFAVGSLGAARLYRTLRPGSDPLGPLVAGTVFVANPYVVVAGTTQAILLPWALLPWQLLCLVHALRVPDGAGRWARWRWPAGFALAFAATSGMNAGVVPLFQLVAVPVVVAVVRPGSWRRALAVVGRCAVLVVAVSLYWIVPSVLALGAGATVVDNSRHRRASPGPSSAAEVLRGLGLWPLYGSGGRGVWLPEFAGYLTSPVVVLASFALPVLAVAGALLVRGPLRRLGLGLLLVAVPIMVGLFPVAPPGAVRPRAGLGVRAPAVRGGVPDHEQGRRGARARRDAAGHRRRGRGLAALARPRPAGGGGGVVALVLAGSTLPAWTGHLYVSSVDLPPYWQQAAAELNAGRPTSGSGSCPARCRPRTGGARTARTTCPLRCSTAVGGAHGDPGDLGAGGEPARRAGRRAAGARLPPGALSTAARYLGVGDLLLRNDVVWELTGGARPAQVRAQLDADPGLRQDGEFGGPGRTRLADGAAGVGREAALPPLQRYAVDGPARSPAPTPPRPPCWSTVTAGRWRR